MLSDNINMAKDRGGAFEMAHEACKETFRLSHAQLCDPTRVGEQN